MTAQAAQDTPGGAGAVLRNRLFLFLWLAQVATQIGANMVLFGLTVMVREATDMSSTVSLLFLTFLMPSVLFSALAGVYVDRFDRRWVLIVTNVLRAALLVAIFAVDGNITAVLLLNVVFATVTVFFAPAEASMIPVVVPREQLVAANGLFTLTINGAFALGFAFLGPLIVTITGGPEPVVLIVAVLYGIAAVLCVTLPSDKPAPRAHLSLRGDIGQAGQAVSGTFEQLREGIAYIRANPSISWSLTYLGIAASLVGILGVLGPGFAEQALGLATKDLIVVVLPLGLGIVMGVLLLNAYGRLVARRRAIEAGLIALGVLLVILSIAGPVSRFLTGVGGRVAIVDLAALTSLVAVVVAIAFLAGVAYGIVAISSQTQLQEDIADEARGRVFGVLNMLISVASILPIIVVGYIADVFSTTAVIFAVAILVVLSGIVSIVARAPEHEGPRGSEIVPGIAVDGIGVTIRPPEGELASRPRGGPEPGSGL
ncbi:MAG: MFS transporter [Chloroflexi bacterium]|nr:MFS transporter [Chloroflexota bacterium]